MGLDIKIENFAGITRAIVTCDLLTRFQSNILECKFIVDNSLPKEHHRQRDKSSKHRETLGAQTAFLLLNAIAYITRYVTQTLYHVEKRVQDSEWEMRRL